MPAPVKTIHAEDSLVAVDKELQRSVNPPAAACTSASSNSIIMPSIEVVTVISSSTSQPIHSPISDVSKSYGVQQSVVKQVVDLRVSTDKDKQNTKEAVVTSLDTEEPSKAATRFCSECEESNRQLASVQCLSCKEDFCKQHFDKIHKHKVMRAHESKIIITAPAAPILCSECVTVVAEVRCDECTHNFCPACSENIHKLRINSTHHLRPLLPGDASAATVPDSEPTQLQQQVERLSAAVTTSTKTKEPLAFYCEICSQTFNSVAQLAQHEQGRPRRSRLSGGGVVVTSALTNSFEGYECTSCGKLFATTAPDALSDSDHRPLLLPCKHSWCPHCAFERGYARVSSSPPVCPTVASPCPPTSVSYH